MARLTHQKAQSQFLSLFIIICLGAFVYSFMLTDTFKTLDDKAAIVNNDLIKDFSNVKDVIKKSYFGENSYWRPLVFVSYMIDYHFFQLNPFYYYITNIILHLSSAIAVFFLIRLFYPGNTFAFFTALLFATHPIQWEAVANIPGRAILLSAFFYILAFYLFCYSRRAKPNLLVYALSCISFGLALLSKESGAMLPILILAYLWIYERPQSNKKIGYLLWSIPYFLILGGYLLIRQILGMVSLFYPRTMESALLEFFTFFRSVITHLRLFLFPIDLHFDRTRAVFTSVANPEVLITILLFCMFCFFLIRYSRRMAPNNLFFLLWFFIDLVPVSQLIVSLRTEAQRISTAEHFLYSASVGIFVLIMETVRWICNKNERRRIIDERVLKFVFLGVYLFLMLTTIQQNIIASSEVAMLEQSLRHNPDNVRMIESYGYALADAGRFEEGEKFFRQILEHNPRHVRARISLGKILCDQGRCVEGMLEYEKLGDVGELQGLLEGNKKATFAIVIKRYENLLADQPLNARLHYSLGIVYAKTQRTQEAIVAFEEAIRLRPDFKEAIFNLASVHDGLENRGQARLLYEKVLSLKGGKQSLDDYARKRLEELR